MWFGFGQSKIYTQKTLLRFLGFLTRIPLVRLTHNRQVPGSTLVGPPLTLFALHHGGLTRLTLFLLVDAIVEACASALPGPPLNIQ